MYYTVWKTQCLLKMVICFQENPVMNFSHPWETHYQRCFPLQHVLKSGLLVASHLSMQAEILVLTLLTAKRNKKQFFLILPLLLGPRGLIPPPLSVSMTVEKWHSEAAPIAYFGHVHIRLNYFICNIQLRVCAKHVLAVREWLWMI